MRKSESNQRRDLHKFTKIRRSGWYQSYKWQDKGQKTKWLHQLLCNNYYVYCMASNLCQLREILLNFTSPRGLKCLIMLRSRGPKDKQPLVLPSINFHTKVLWYFCFRFQENQVHWSNFQTPHNWRVRFNFPLKLIDPLFHHNFYKIIFSKKILFYLSVNG